MAAQEQDVITTPDDKAEILRKVNRTLATIAGNVSELQELIEALIDSPTKRARQVDEYGEPTWVYLVKRKLPADFYLTRKLLEYGQQYGFNEQSMTILLRGHGSYRGFLAHYRESGKKWQDWTSVFQRWVRTERERKDKAKGGSSNPTRFDRQRTRS